jgi:hypothetical protein
VLTSAKFLYTEEGLRTKTTQGLCIRAAAEYAAATASSFSDSVTGRRCDTKMIRSGRTEDVVPACPLRRMGGLPRFRLAGSPTSSTGVVSRNPGVCTLGFIAGSSCTGHFLGLPLPLFAGVPATSAVATKTLITLKGPL